MDGILSLFLTICGTKSNFSSDGSSEQLIPRTVLITQNPGCGAVRLARELHRWVTSSNHYQYRSFQFSAPELVLEAEAGMPFSSTMSLNEIVQTPSRLKELKVCMIILQGLDAVVEGFSHGTINPDTGTISGRNESTIIGNGVNKVWSQTMVRRHKSNEIYLGYGMVRRIIASF